MIFPSFKDNDMNFAWSDKTREKTIDAEVSAILMKYGDFMQNNKAKGRSFSLLFGTMEIRMVI